MDSQPGSQPQIKSPSHLFGRKLWIAIIVLFFVSLSAYFGCRYLLHIGWTKVQLPSEYGSALITASAVDAFDRVWLAVSSYENNSNYLFEYSPESGWKSHDVDTRILDIDFTEKGQLWLGSGEGVLLFKADGSFMKIPGQAANTIAVDKQGHVWIGTNDYSRRSVGLNVLSQEGNWITYTVNNSNLVNGQINDIEVDPLGRVWIGTHGGINVVNPDGTWTTFTSSNSILLDDDVVDFAFDDKGQVWIMTDSNDFYLIDQNGEWKSITRDSADIMKPLTKMGVDKQGHLWVGDRHGLNMLEHNGQWIYYTPINSGWDESAIDSLGFDTQSRIYTITIFGGTVLDERQAISPQLRSVVFSTSRFMLFTMIASLIVICGAAVISLPQVRGKKTAIDSTSEGKLETQIENTRRNIASIVSLIVGILIYIMGFITQYLLPMVYPPEATGEIQNYYQSYAILVLALIAIISGIISLIQIKKSGESGKWLAIIGIILGVIPFMCLLAIILYMNSPLYF